MTFVTHQHIEEWVDAYAADYPLEALRELVHWLTEFRLDASWEREP